ncbi:MAG: hypothetical protein WCI02_15940 [Planctomycetota bacterium]
MATGNLRIGYYNRNFRKFSKLFLKALQQDKIGSDVERHRNFLSVQKIVCVMHGLGQTFFEYEFYIRVTLLGPNAITQISTTALRRTGTPIGNLPEEHNELRLFRPSWQWRPRRPFEFLSLLWGQPTWV